LISLEDFRWYCKLKFLRKFKKIFNLSEDHPQQKRREAEAFRRARDSIPKQASVSGKSKSEIDR
jgi:hypothetical protein